MTERKMTDGFFLCCGVPKSGTTFLQRTLDLHPDVSCPSEQNLDAVLKNVEKFFTDYNNQLRHIDRRTGGQGAPTVNSQIASTIFRETVLCLARGFARGEKVWGLNDNAVFYRIQFYDELFDGPPLICIFRNPVDLAISTWRHNHRLAREEPDKAANHLKFLENPEGTLKGYIGEYVRNFSRIADRFLGYAANRPNILVIRYETLVEDKKTELRRLFSFLGVDTSSVLLRTIEARSTPEQMAAVSAQPAFFGLNDAEKDRLRVDGPLRQQMLKGCARQMARLGELALA